MFDKKIISDQTYKYLDREISHFNMNSKHLGKCQFVLNLIPFSTVSNLFPLDVVQKCQCYQLMGKLR